MIKVFLITSLLLSFQLAFAQLKVDNKELADDLHYVRVSSISLAYGAGARVMIDYGQMSNRMRNQNFRDAQNKKIDFNNAIDAINYLARHGWEVVTSKSELMNDGRYREDYLMRRVRPNQVQTVTGVGNPQDNSGK
jgi:uncharacterized protein YnzC (UPF0291/DUF896 family)